MNIVSFRRVTFIGFLCVTAILFFGMNAWAQTTGTIAGTVTDTSGRAVPGARVKATLQERSTTRTTVTNRQGGYVMPVLGVGHYTVTVKAQGFKTFTQGGITLTAGEDARVDAHLEVGNVTQTVNVTAQPPLIDTRTSQYGALISPASVEDLPLNGRNVVDLIELLPGVSNVDAPESFTGDRSGPTYSSNGTRANGNLYLFDGMPYNALFRNTGLNYPPPDAVQEIHVITGSYSAEYGRNGGSVFSVVTKSGTDHLHGGAWEYLRNDALNANDYFAKAAGQPIPKLIENQFGFDAGGPILKKKLFIFGAYEGLRKREGALHSGVFTPTQVQRSGDFSGDCSSGFDANGVCLDRSKGKVTDQIYAPQTAMFTSQPCDGQPAAVNPCAGQAFADNKIPSADFDAISQKFMSEIPLPDATTGEYTTETPEPTNNNEFMARVDYNLGHNDLFGRYDQGHTTETDFGGDIPSYEPISLTADTYSPVFGGTFVFGAGLINQLRIGYTRFVSNEPTSAKESLHSMGSSFPVIGPPTPPEVTIGSFTLGTNSSVNQVDTNEIFDINDSFEQEIGTHDLRYGVEFLRASYLNNTNTFGMGGFNFNGQVTADASGLGGDPVADFLLGVPKSLEVDSPSLNQAGIQKSFYAYVEDNWHIQRRLTLNLGVRYELNVPWFQPDNYWATFHPGQQSTVFPGAPLGEVFYGDKGVPRGMYRTQYFDFLPRFGFAWDIQGNGKTVLRGAYGIYNDMLGANVIQNKDQPFNYSFSYPLSGSNPDYIIGGLADPLLGQPAIPLTVDLKNPTFIGTASVFSPDPNNVTPYIQDVTLNVQRQLTANMMLQIGYVGQFGRHLWTDAKINAKRYDPTTGKLSSPYPYAGGITDFSTNTNSTYNGLQVYLSRRLSRGLQLTGAYAYASCIDQGSNYNESGSGAVPQPWDLASERGHCEHYAGSSRHIFSASGIWHIPAPAARSFVNTLTHNWEISTIIKAQSGQYWNVTTGKDNADSGTPNQRPNLVGDPNTGTCSNGDAVGSLNCYFNTSAFAVPDKYLYGDLARDTALSPGSKNVDIAVLRDFPWGEHRSIQFRAEAYNALNITNFEFGKNTVKMSSGKAFGVITDAGSARELQFALKVHF